MTDSSSRSFDRFQLCCGWLHRYITTRRVGFIFIQSTDHSDPASTFSGFRFSPRPRCIDQDLRGGATKSTYISPHFFFRSYRHNTYVVVRSAGATGQATARLVSYIRWVDGAADRLDRPMESVLQSQTPLAHLTVRGPPHIIMDLILQALSRTASIWTGNLRSM